MRTFIEEFRVFAMRGNVIDLAVAVVIGSAFGRIVTSLVDDLITPFLGLFLGGVDVSARSFAINGVVFSYGSFIQSVISFVIIAFVVFVIVKAMNRISRVSEKEKQDAASKPAEPSEEVQLLRDIRDELKR